MDKTVVVAGDPNLETIIDGDIDNQQIIDGQPFPYYNGPGGGTYEHNRLIHRDYEDQHPIEAITQLLQELAARPTDALSNMDIQEILNH